MDGEEIKGKHKYINLVTKILDEFGTLWLFFQPRKHLFKQAKIFYLINSYCS
jgi:hypothetical protein